MSWGIELWVSGSHLEVMIHRVISQLPYLLLLHTSPQTRLSLKLIRIDSIPPIEWFWHPQLHPWMLVIVSLSLGVNEHY